MTDIEAPPSYEEAIVQTSNGQQEVENIEQDGNQPATFTEQYIAMLMIAIMTTFEDKNSTDEKNLNKLKILKLLLISKRQIQLEKFMTKLISIN